MTLRASASLLVRSVKNLFLKLLAVNYENIDAKSGPLLSIKGAAGGGGLRMSLSYLLSLVRLQLEQC